MSDFEALLKQLPSLKKLIDTSGDMSLFEYASEMYHGVYDTSPLFLSRKREFLDFIWRYVGQKFDSLMGKIVVEGLQKNYAISTAEHHGPMWHPFFFQSALLRAITRPYQPVINFATSHVSLGNSSYPRGLVFHAQNNKEERRNNKAGIDCSDNKQNELNQLNALNSTYLRLPFFGSKLRMCPVFRLPAYTREDIENHCLWRLKFYLREWSVTEEIYQKILSFICDQVLDPKILAYSSYSEQITALNQSWWKELFSESPAYIPLDAEEMVIALLEKHLQEETIIGRMITDVSLQSIIEEQFDGISCCFNRAKKRGTYLFWYLDEEHKRHTLWRKWDALCTEDGSLSIRMNKDDILASLHAGALIPSGLLVYTLFSCYYGIACFGGFAQGEYLPQIQKAYWDLLWVLSESQKQLSTQWSILNEDMVFLYEKTWEISTALDRVVKNIPFADILEASKSVSVSSSIQKMYYEIARCL